VIHCSMEWFCSRETAKRVPSISWATMCGLKSRCYSKKVALVKNPHTGGDCDLIKENNKVTDEQVKPNDGSGNRQFVLQTDPGGAFETSGRKTCGLNARVL